MCGRTACTDRCGGGRKPGQSATPCGPGASRRPYNASRRVRRKRSPAPHGRRYRYATSAVVRARYSFSAEQSSRRFPYRIREEQARRRCCSRGKAIAREARSRPVNAIVARPASRDCLPAKPIVPSRRSLLPRSSPTAVVAVCSAVDREQARARPWRQAALGLDVTVLNQRLPLRVVKRSPRRRQLGRCCVSSTSITWASSPPRSARAGEAAT